MSKTVTVRDVQADRKATIAAVRRIIGRHIDLIAMLPSDTWDQCEKVDNATERLEQQLCDAIRADIRKLDRMMEKRFAKLADSENFTQVAKAFKSLGERQ